MAKLEQKTKTPAKTKAEVDEPEAAETTTRTRLMDELDELLDEIDTVLEHTDFVAAYVQKGGE